jgi:hypothetical protein
LPLLLRAHFLLSCRRSCSASRSPTTAAVPCCSVGIQATSTSRPSVRTVV